MWYRHSVLVIVPGAGIADIPGRDTRQTYPRRQCRRRRWKDAHERTPRHIEIQLAGDHGGTVWSCIEDYWGTESVSAQRISRHPVHSI